MRMSSSRDDGPCRRCRHADCAMDRGDPLPDPVTGARWPDGREYVASPGGAGSAAESDPVRDAAHLDSE